MFIFDEDKVIEIFCTIDDFCKIFEEFEKTITIQDRNPTRVSRLARSEIITILVLYHQSGYKTFKYFYCNFVCKALKSYFPDLVTYDHFLTLMKRVFMPIMALMYFLCKNTGHHGIYFVDATKLPVCDNHREKRHKVFEDLARKGKTSTGWFFGLKLHLVINELGQIVAFKITPGNVADNNHDVLKFLFKDLKGKVFGDKGYLSKLFEFFIQKGLQIVAKLKDKTRKRKTTDMVDAFDMVLDRKRGFIESVNDILKNNCDVWHTRHRSPANAIIHLVAGLIAYQFRDRKPSIII